MSSAGGESGSDQSSEADAERVEVLSLLLVHMWSSRAPTIEPLAVGLRP